MSAEYAFQRSQAERAAVVVWLRKVSRGARIKEAQRFRLNLYRRFIDTVAADALSLAADWIERGEHRKY